MMVIATCIIIIIIQIQYSNILTVCVVFNVNVRSSGQFSLFTNILCDDSGKRSGQSTSHDR